MASAVQIPIPAMTETQMKIVRSATCAVVAGYEGLRLKSVSSDTCELKYNAFGPVHDSLNAEHDDDQHILDRKLAYVFLAGVIAEQKAFGREPVMPRYTFDSLPQVLRTAARVSEDAWKQDETFWTDLKSMFLQIRDLLRSDEVWREVYWFDCLCFAETLMVCECEITGIAAEALIQTFSGSEGRVTFKHVTQRVLGMN
jgi:hypothetical protein